MTVLSGRIGRVKPPRSVSAGGMDDAYEGGIDVTNSTCSVDDCERTDIRARDLARWVVETYPDEVAQLFQDSLFGNDQAVPTN